MSPQPWLTRTQGFYAQTKKDPEILVLRCRKLRWKEGGEFQAHALVFMQALARDQFVRL